MKHLALAFALLAAACGGKSSSPPATPESTGGDPPAEAPAEAQVEDVVLTNLEQGDIACYVWFSPDGESEEMLHGNFELCPGGPDDASELIGETVTLTTRRGNVQAASCEGDPDCTDSEEVDLVTAITSSP